MKEIQLNNSDFEKVTLAEELSLKCRIVPERIIDSLYENKLIEEEDNGKLRISTTVLLGRDRNIPIKVVWIAEKRNSGLRIVDVIAS
jgi:hypothetical protein